MRTIIRGKCEEPKQNAVFLKGSTTPAMSKYTKDVLYDVTVDCDGFNEDDKN